MSYMAGDYYAGDYYAGGLLSKIGTFLRKSPIIGKLPVIGQLQGAVNLAHAIHPPHATGTNPSNLPAVVPAHETALQGFVRRGGHLTTTGRLKAMAEHNAALQPKIAPPAHVMGLGARRRMNWANPRALARAERRIHSAVKHMTKYIRWVHPTKAGHAVPRFGKKRSKR